MTSCFHEINQGLSSFFKYTEHIFACLVITLRRGSFNVGNMCDTRSICVALQDERWTHSQEIWTLISVTYCKWDKWNDHKCKITFTRKTHNKQQHVLCITAASQGEDAASRRSAACLKVTGAQETTKQNLPETALVGLAEEGCFKHSVEHMLRQRAWLKRCPLLMSTQSTMSPSISANFSGWARRDGWQEWSGDTSLCGRH